VKGLGRPFARRREPMIVQESSCVEYSAEISEDLP
jgi:hypothetical protein